MTDEDVPPDAERQVLIREAVQDLTEDLALRIEAILGLAAWEGVAVLQHYEDTIATLLRAMASAIEKR
jgi:hypothetical protein